MSKTDQVYREIVRHLEQTHLPFEIRDGGCHRKIYLGGRMVGILPMRARSALEGDGRAMKNVIAQIRRAAKQIKEAA